MRAALKQHKDIYKAVHRAQHVQRNWNLDATMPENDVEIILEAAQQATSKQNRAFYKVHAIQDRELIEKIHAETMGFGVEDKITSNPQTLAHLVLVFEEYVQPGTLETSIEHQRRMGNNMPRSHFEVQLKRDQHMAVGVAAGAINITAAMLGYGTGCCACFRPEQVKELLNMENNPMLIMGIGIPGDKNRRVHHQDENFIFPTFDKEPIEVVTH